MCGIVGFISGAGKSGYPQDRTKFIRQGLVVDALRGMDSTGIFSTRVGTETMTAAYLKQAVNGAQFVCTKKFNEHLEKPEEFRAVIGHNRSATAGSVKTDNAHPFQEGNVTLVHNGTLNSSYYMPKPERELKQAGVEVDSHVICHNLAAKPVADWYKDMHGSWALVWHDAEDGSINIVRNDSRPLHLAKIEKEDTILICSEADMLTFLARRSGAKIEDLYTIKPHHHFKWLPDTKVLEPVVTELSRAWTYPSRSDAANDVDNPLWWSSGYRHGGRGSAHYQPPFTAEGNQVRLGGKLRPVPQAHQAMLYEMDMEVEDRLPFQPWLRIQDNRRGLLPTGHSVVTGWLPGAECPAIVHGVPSLVASGALANSKREWLVRPVGIYEPDREEEADTEAAGPYVICLYVQAYVPAVSKNQKPDGVTALGPDGKRISVEAFHALVKDGCSLCTGNISWLDDEDIMWDDPTHPLCAVCTGQLTSRLLG